MNVRAEVFIRNVIKNNSLVNKREQALCYHSSGTMKSLLIDSLINFL